MSLILNIDTALDKASVCLSENGEVIRISYNENQKDHASWLHAEIADILGQTGFRSKDLKSVAVSTGPGSFTGLRIGLAAAKGFCYALDIPLITVNSLKLIAYSVRDEALDMICPLIDARRMEVFTALYDKGLNEKMAPYALILDDKSFVALVSAGKVLFCGNGIKKLQPLLSNQNAVFSNTDADASHLAQLSFTCFKNHDFADLAYTEPLYVKEFFSYSHGK